MTMTTRLRAVLLPAMASGALVAGCGGDDGGDQLSASEYRSQATKICTDSEKETNALEQPKTPDDLKTYLEKGISITEDSLDEFADLQPPDELKDKHQAAVDAERKAVDKLKEITGELKGNATDSAAIEKFDKEISAISDDVDNKLKAAGLDKCAE